MRSPKPARIRAGRSTKSWSAPPKNRVRIGDVYRFPKRPRGRNLVARGVKPALSRLIPIYGTGIRKERIAIAEIDLRTQRFARGATQLRFVNGNVIEDLSVQRSQMMSAISLIKRAGLPFSCGFVPREPSTEAPGEPQAETDQAPAEKSPQEK